MPLIDTKRLQAEAQEEINKEAGIAAKNQLKELYRKREKAVLVLKNIDREIDSYLAQVAEMTTYEAAGVDVTAGK